ncbi:hypothetical protein EMIHUDRAFT_237151 [Emiliania huxleyi CCMP1516]|uniref:Uncharacterized protein n=2 Tax=Emiliania huxleyi TaxID=2903 RepID=A0A0D3JR82_EMIH1|nr:hypothetical protein EMIHUDRAFT_237151 [Emiliania huxleyi CCMP1516]EOD26017.1 hypothetical protein EMIHUDRAFT_237151 [Emiliania huxleyi CCMP1516]|eukprot:XP_005778446.1 hypothetical protein EMIHUDRAFT_237151 [Emiliania huxleyi CCMP1516]
MAYWALEALDGSKTALSSLDSPAASPRAKRNPGGVIAGLVVRIFPTLQGWDSA